MGYRIRSNYNSNTQQQDLLWIVERGRGLIHRLWHIIIRSCTFSLSSLAYRLFCGQLMSHCNWRLMWPRRRIFICSCIWDVMRCGHLSIILFITWQDCILNYLQMDHISDPIFGSKHATSDGLSVLVSSYNNPLRVSECTLRFSIGITHLSSHPSPCSPPFPINRVSDFRNSPLLRCLTWKLFVIDHNNYLYPSSAAVSAMHEQEHVASQWNPILSQSIILSPPVWKLECRKGKSFTYISCHYDEA